MKLCYFIIKERAIDSKWLNESVHKHFYVFDQSYDPQDKL